MWTESLPRALALISVALLLTACVPEPDPAMPTISPSPSHSASPAPTATPSAPPTVSPTPESSIDPRLTVDVTIVTLDFIDGALEATAIVTGVVEEGGMCTLTVSMGVDELTAVASGTAGPESTYCGLMTIPGDDLPDGEWEAVIDYSSEGSQGRSDREVVTVR